MKKEKYKHTQWEENFKILDLSALIYVLVI